MSEAGEKERAAEKKAALSRALDETVKLACEVRAKLMENGYSNEAASNASGFLTMTIVMAAERRY
jgi:hypothetical protein